MGCGPVRMLAVLHVLKDADVEDRIKEAATPID